MIKEILEEIKFIKENPVCIFLILTITGILPSTLIGIMSKILS